MSTIGADGKVRCFGGEIGKEFYGDYHDNEWGIPVYDDQKLFEMLILEGAQAGLSWETVLRKRDGYREAFYQFDVKRCAAMRDEECQALRGNPAIIRNKLKIYSVRKNAAAFIKIQQEFGSFSVWLWAYVDGKPLFLRPKTRDELKVTSDISDAISKALKKRGMSFVGSTIIYAYMQAIGMVNEHMADCWKA